MSQNEARIKLSVDTTQAQRNVRDLGNQIHQLGSGPSPQVREAMGEGSQSTGTAEDSVNSQRKLVNSLEDYLSGVEKSNEKMLAALDSIEQYLRGGAGGTGNGGNNGGGGGGTPSGKSSGGGNDLMGKLSKTLFSMQAISSAISATVNYMKNGAAAAQSNEMAAYKAYGTTGLYSNYSTARNSTSALGLSLGFNASDSIAVANGIIGGTGAGTQDEVNSDITAILRASRGLNVDEGALTSSATGFYQTGTYSRGQMQQFTNLLGTLVEESGMRGREDETLEVLNAIHSSLKDNLTNITESQYESTLGLYSLMSQYNSNYQGAKGSNILENLNSFITGDSTGVDVALGWGTQYQGWGGYWELAQRKEQGLGNPENLKNILETFNAYSSYEVGSEEYMGQLYKYLNSSFGADTAFTQFIADNMDTILSGDYSEEFSKQLAEAAGTELIDNNVSSYEDTSLATKNQYDVEKENAQEQTSSSVENKLGWWQKFYNGLPTGVQSTLSVLGGVGETAAQGAAAYGGFKGLQWLGGKLFGTGASAAGTAAGAAGATSAGAGAATAGGGLWSSITSGLGRGLTSASNFIAANPAAVEWLGIYGPAIPDAINTWSAEYEVWADKRHAKNDSTYGEYYNWVHGEHNYSGNDAFKEMQSAISSGTFDSWLEDWLQDTYRVNPDTGEAKDYDFSSEKIWAILNNNSYDAYKNTNFANADEAREWYQSLSDEQLNSLLNYDSLTSGYTALTDKEAAQRAAQAQAGNYYDTSDWQTMHNTPFYGEETAFGWELGGSYTKDDLQTLKNTMIKDYVENGFINVQDYFGDYMYNGGSYAKKVNEVLKEMFGTDTGVSSWFGKEIFSKQNATGNKLSEGIEDILDDYTDEYDSIVAASSTATESLDSNTEAIEQLTTDVSEMREWLEENGYNGTAVWTEQSVRDTYNKEHGIDATSLFGTNNRNPLNPFSLFNYSKWGGSHATGNDYVPYDGYIAELHKGEAVLDKVSADEYRSGSSGNMNSQSTLEIRLSGSIDGMTEENQGQIVKAVVAQIEQKMNSNNMMNMLGNGMVRFAN